MNMTGEADDNENKHGKKLKKLKNKKINLWSETSMATYLKLKMRM